MPLANAKQAVIDAVGAIVEATTITAPDGKKAANPNFDPKKEWAKVAEAFFSEGLNPGWIDHSAGKAAFENTFMLDPVTFGQAWSAYAATASASAAPMPPGISVTPPTGVPGMPTVTAAENPPDHVKYATQLFNELVKWTQTGQVAQPAPASPVPWA